MAHSKISFPLQAAVDCDLCEGHIKVDWYCLTCPANLCEKCKSLHTSRKNFKKHEVISRDVYKKHKELEETRTISKCPSHPKNDITLECFTCRVLVCHECIVSTHNGHIFEDLQAKLYRSKEKLTKILGKLDRKDKYIVDQLMRNFEQLKTVDNKAEKAKNKIIETRDAAVACVVAESDNLIQQIDSRINQNKSAVSTSNSKLQSVHKDIQNIMKNVQTKMECQNAIVINYFLQEAQKTDKIDLRCFTRLSVPTFLDDVSQSTTMIGTLHFDDFVVQKHSPHSPTLSDIKVISTVSTQVMATEMRAIGATQIWCSYFDEGSLQLYDQNGENTMSLSLNFKVKGFVINEEGNFIVCDVDDKSIKQVTPDGHVSTLCSTRPQTPWGICLNQRQQPVVCLDNSLVIYSADCQIKLREFTHDQHGNPLFVWSYRVATNGDRDYCVADTDGYKVVTIDVEGELRWTYSGGQEEEGFKPWNICCDSRMDVFVADTDNNKVHVLDNDGHLIMYVTDSIRIKQPRGLAVSYDDTLWIGEETDSKKVHILKYLKDPWEK